MKDYLKEHLETISKFDKEWTYFQYEEDVDNKYSFIHKVGVLCAIDRNKCDWVHVAIGTQRSENSIPELKGTFYFNEGENDDIGRVIKRAVELLKYVHPVFED